MSPETEELLRELAVNAESVCRHYLPAGRREGMYWLVGDLQNHPGRSLFVRLSGPTSGTGAAGKWTDAATGEHGDLLDIIRERTGITRFPDLLTEARTHLGRPVSLQPEVSRKPESKSRGDTREAAARLFAASVPISGTLAETYLRSRGITCSVPDAVLRFHPKCWYREEGARKAVPMPAMIAAVTDAAGRIHGVHRTWLAADGGGKADVRVPKRAMGLLIGNAVRIDPALDILVIGEGIETMLSIREAAPGLPVWAGLSSFHLGAVSLPESLQRLYIARDGDPAGERAAEKLSDRATAIGIAVQLLEPRLGDFNDDLRTDGPDALRRHLAEQIGPEDRHRIGI
ncbi:MAG: DNA primase [Cereibacter sphaeroides]|uniref:DNA primase n=1 Tax=Cereibacter sphaeroides TaxID=1063 RepID=A0A2W5S570_CERSP|nr:MAG: DNA primase [Cereibacter sphaeroides]